MKKCCGWRTGVNLRLAKSLAVGVALVATAASGFSQAPLQHSQLEASFGAAALSRAEAAGAAGENAAYNEAIRAFVMDLQQQLPPSSWSGSFLAEPYVVAFDGAKIAPSMWAPSYFDSLVPASDIPSKSLRSRTTRAGYGVPFVGIRAATPDRQAEDPYALKGATIVPVTVTVDFERGSAGGTRKARVHLWNPYNATESIAADFSAPLELILQQNPKTKLARKAFFDPGKYEEVQGLYMLTPYQAGKIPVVMVHGLDSLPRTWQDVYNELIADPVIRARYQFWVYRYPTGAPVVVSSMELRNSLDAARAHVDPKHKDKALDRMILIGHSMGGLLSRMMVTESGDTFWRQISNVPLESVDLPAQDKAYWQRMAFFHPKPYVKRVVFIATPHRGSTLASGSVGRLAKRMVKVPMELTGVTVRAAMSLPPGVSSEFARLAKDMPTSIDNLSPENRFVLHLQVQPITVPHHSIVGTQGVMQGGKPISDGIVPYWSTHLDTAESEVWVNSGHSAHEHPDAIRELHRILLLHLSES